MPRFLVSNQAEVNRWSVCECQCLGWERVAVGWVGHSCAECHPPQAFGPYWALYSASLGSLVRCSGSCQTVLFPLFPGAQVGRSPCQWLSSKVVGHCLSRDQRPAATAGPH